MFGSSIIKSIASGAIEGMTRNLDSLATLIREGKTDQALALVSEMKSALEKLRSYLK
jgi:hypothetical protein